MLSGAVHVGTKELTVELVSIEDEVEDSADEVTKLNVDEVKVADSTDEVIELASEEVTVLLGVAEAELLDDIDTVEMTEEELAMDETVTDGSTETEAGYVTMMLLTVDVVLTDAVLERPLQPRRRTRGTVSGSGVLSITSSRASFAKVVRLWNAPWN